MRAEPAPAKGPEPHAAGWPAALSVALLTAAAYALASLLVGALALDGSGGIASPLYPSAGIGLAAVLCYGRAALPGVALGSLIFNVSLALERGSGGGATVLLPLAVGAGAALQAAVGAALVRRHVAQPLVLQAPRDVLRFALLAAVGACCISATVGTLALLATGGLAASAWLGNWLTWWLGDTLGVLTCAPLALTLIGRPRDEWAPRRLTVGLPLLLALALMVAGVMELHRLDRQRLQATFERDADRLASEVEARLALPLHALEALHSVARVRVPLDPDALREASAWWLAQPIALQAVGYSERVARDALPAFEAQAQAQGLAGYRVFDRDGGSARGADGEVVALRLIEPLRGNAGALGVNALSIPAARAAILSARATGQPTATAGFRLTQSDGEETGLVLYQALYRSAPADEVARRTLFRGVVFVTVRSEHALADLGTADTRYLQWRRPAPGRRRSAGCCWAAGCWSCARTPTSPACPAASARPPGCCRWWRWARRRCWARCCSPSRATAAAPSTRCKKPPASCGARSASAPAPRPRCAKARSGCATSWTMRRSA